MVVARWMKLIILILPAIPYESLTDEFVNDYFHNPESGFRKYLHENNVYNWRPKPLCSFATAMATEVNIKMQLPLL